jgi:hypothetical protein
VRYADDWLLGFAGPKREAEEIKSKIGTFLRDELNLELSESKTLITRATSGTARFLGYEITAQHADDKLDRRGQRAVNGAIGLFVPKTVIGQRCALYMSGGNRHNEANCFMTTTSPSSPSSRLNTEGSSSTTSSPKTYFAWACSDGSWRPHCSRPWLESTVPRSPRWLESTKRQPRHPTDRANHLEAVIKEFLDHYHHACAWPCEGTRWWPAKVRTLDRLT